MCSWLNSVWTCSDNPDSYTFEIGSTLTFNSSESCRVNVDISVIFVCFCPSYKVIFYFLNTPYCFLLIMCAGSHTIMSIKYLCGFKPLWFLWSCEAVSIGTPCQKLLHIRWGKQVFLLPFSLLYLLAFSVMTCMFSNICHFQSSKA